MSTSELSLTIGLIVALIILPLGATLLVRILVPLHEEAGAEEADVPFETLRDFWESNIPHLRELRNRLVKCLIAITLGTSIGFWVVNSGTLLGKTLPEVLIDQFVPPTVQLQTTGFAEEFVGYMRIALVIGVALAMPVVIYQIVAFLAPALRPGEKRMLFTALPFVTELFIAGLAFGWFFTIPAALEFLATFGTTERIRPQPTLSNFISTVSTLLLWNGVVFELPAVIYLLARLGLVNTGMLMRTRRYAIVVIVIVAAVITPTGDPYNLLLLAVPMYVLYELGILLTRFVPKQASPNA